MLTPAKTKSLLNYEKYGLTEGREPLTERETRQPDLELDLCSSETEYLYIRQLVEASGLWDETWYLREYHRMFTFARRFEGFQGTPLDFFLRIGWSLGHRPCEAFRNIVPATAGANPLVDLLVRRRFSGYQFVDNSWFPEPAKLEHYFDHRASRKHSPVRKVCYTCITGGYDRLIQPYYIDPHWDYVCFTDDVTFLESQQVGVWQIRPLVVSSGENTARNNRWHKVNPHIALSEYDCSLYVDGNINVISSYIFDLVGSDDCEIAMPLHFERTCLYDEIDVLLSAGRFSTEHQALEAQREFFLREGFPRNYRLTENNLIYRQHHLEDVRELMELWWSLIREYSYRDQASFMYAHWKSGASGELVTFPNCRTLYKDFWVVKHLDTPSEGRVR